MKKQLVLFHSQTGNNRFLATKLAEGLSADVQEIKTNINNLGCLFFFSWLKLGMSVNTKAEDLKNYDEVILMGPIWGGQLVAPLSAAIKQCVKAEKPVHFVTCCGTDETEKDTTWGYARVFEKAKEKGKGYVKTFHALPVRLVLSEEEAKDKKKLEAAKVDEASYGGKMEKALNDLVEELR